MKLFVFAAIITCGSFLLFMGIRTANRAVQAEEAEEVAHEWRMQRIAETYEAIDRMYQCTTEIYSTLKGGGPICKDACKKYDEIRHEEQQHLAWMAGQPVIGTPDPKVCGLEDKRTEEKP